MSNFNANLTGQVAIVTGAGGGLGSVFCEALAKAGAHVVAADYNGTAAEATASRLKEQGFPICSFKVDVTSPEETEALAAFAREAFERVDILVNTAAFMEPVLQPLLQYPMDLWRRTLDVNLTGPLNCIRAVAPIMSARTYGRIINISSGGAYSAAHAYGVSKLALQGLTSWLATELGSSGITVNAIAPGALNTAQGDKARPPQYVEMLRAVTPLKPLGEPDDLIGALLFLASDASSWTTGQTVRVDGGWIKSVL
ncbi:SDR family oxidoreductase [Paraburkholderia phymatum]|uniref:SDR family oxidoreductase n=1 Tax=Paraburkholderia phymatum TaxID=148447 RepID=UPI0031771C51